MRLIRATFVDGHSRFCDIKTCANKNILYNIITYIQTEELDDTNIENMLLDYGFAKYKFTKEHSSTCHACNVGHPNRCEFRLSEWEIVPVLAYKLSQNLTILTLDNVKEMIEETNKIKI